MVYEELQRRYGNYVAQRLRQELDASEFNQIEFAKLNNYLDDRADNAHRLYKQTIDNPLAVTTTVSPTGNKKAELLYNQWRDAEDLSYLITIAENVYNHTLTANANA